MKRKNIFIIAGLSLILAVIIVLGISVSLQNVTINNLQDQVKDLKEQVSSCKTLLEKNKDTIEELKASIEELEESNSSYINKIEELNSKKTELEKKNKSLNQKIEKLEKEINELEDCLNGYSFRVSPIEREMMYYIVNAEMGDYSDHAIKMVACVIINRVMSKQFPNTIAGVITQKNQFSTLSIWYNKSKKPYDKVVKIVDQVLAMSPQEINNISEGALFFYEPSICGYKSYFENKQLLYILGGCRFFS